ncbi:AraC family ligand binding domain-containing protein [Endozoicomonas sp. SESOKO1]|uniref:AraC family ligand binding domain-containing protein n=1 Tax=Endozoicomonas sp. SESOKO1 TaxID=2828742 RepID=UPI00214890FC|nr:AraC family ligand binding domain-containing protein [Endozoicomonas sp. SESOKO1]
MEQHPFHVTKEYFGKVYEDDTPGLHTIVYGFENDSKKRERDGGLIPSNGACYGYVHEGQITLAESDEFYLNVAAGFWFVMPDGFKWKAQSEHYRFVVWQRVGYHGNVAVGKVEPEGRLNYIDGCKDSMLQAPIRKGDPCLNALYMPEGVLQTMHTHPSMRAGFIMVGGAKCTTPEKVIDLEDGHIFFMPADVKHFFRSDHGENTVMKLVAYHPDSDFGPTDEIHPMINRTLVDGVSASTMTDIQTKA